MLDPLGAMMNKGRRLTRSLGALPILLALFAVSDLSFADSPEEANSKLPLHSGWMLQSSCRMTATGGPISTRGFDTDGWHATTVPSTVVAALVADKTFRDPYFGENLRSIPGASYPIGDNFALLPMPKDSPFRCSWWYRTEFQLPESYAGRHIWLNFGGINNRANIWVNGHKIAGAQDVAGAYRTYEFDITSRLNRDGSNVLAVETIAQTEKDLGINWVDWNPAPPDKDMGLWREVYVRATGPVTIRHPQVVTHFPGGFLDRADLTVEAEVGNAGASPDRRHSAGNDRSEGSSPDRRTHAGRDSHDSLHPGQVPRAGSSKSASCGGRGRWESRACTHCRCAFSLETRSLIPRRFALESAK